MNNIIRILLLLLSFVICSCEKLDDGVEVTNKPKEVKPDNPTVETTLTVNPSSFDVGYAGSKETAQITSNCDWTIRNTASWCHLSVTKGSGNNFLTITVDENTVNTIRTEIIFIDYDSKTETISIAQSANPYRSPDGNDNTPPSW